MPGPSVASRQSHSRTSAKKLLSTYESKEMRRGIDTLRKRIEKHFGEADEEQLSRQLVGLVCRECERKYERLLERLQDVCKALYAGEEGKQVEIPFAKEDIVAAFGIGR